MSVHLNGRRLCKASPRANRFRHHEVEKFAARVALLQASGVITSRDLAVWLNEQGIENPHGKHWSHAVVFRLLRRAKLAGLPVILRSRSEATSARRVRRRSKSEINAEMNARFNLFVAKVQGNASETDPAIIAALKEVVA